MCKKYPAILKKRTREGQKYPLLSLLGYFLVGKYGKEGRKMRDVLQW